MTMPKRHRPEEHRTAHHPVHGVRRTLRYHQNQQQIGKEGVQPKPYSLNLFLTLRADGTLTRDSESLEASSPTSQVSHPPPQHSNRKKKPQKTQSLSEGEGIEA